MNSENCEQRTNNQVEVIVFRKTEENTFLFLVMKRTLKKGGFWQPITGNVHKEESFEDAGLRELEEETGIIDIIRFIDIEYTFNFFDNNNKIFEKVFGVEVKTDTEITISDEHTEYKWVTAEIALNQYLKYNGNKQGLKKLVAKLRKK